MGTGVGNNSAIISTYRLPSYALVVRLTFDPKVARGALGPGQTCSRPKSRSVRITKMDERVLRGTDA